MFIYCKIDKDQRYMQILYTKTVALQMTNVEFVIHRAD